MIENFLLQVVVRLIKSPFRLILFLSALLLPGCGGLPKNEENTTTFQIKTMETANQGIPFYVVVKSTDFSQFLTDDYRKVATQTVISNTDSTNLLVTYLIPGTTKTFEIKHPKSQKLGIYFIYTQPGEEWKYLMNEKDKHKYKILLGANEIQSITYF